MTEAVTKWTSAFAHLSDLLKESWLEWSAFSDTNQLCLAIPDGTPADLPYRDQLMHGTGSFRLKNWPYNDTDYTRLITGFEYLKPLMDYVRDKGMRPCRPMIRSLQPKTCLSYHSDDAEWRIHMPLDTTWQAFFVIQDKVFRMPEVGSLYYLTTNVMHTAVNANLSKPRLHFTLSAYREHHDQDL